MNNSIIDKYSKNELEKIISECFSKAEFMRKLGYSSTYGRPWEVVKTKLDQLQISYNHFQDKSFEKRNFKNVFVENSTAAQSVLRRYYLKGNYTPYICSVCGQEPFWNNKELTLTLDHINGINNDDRLENLRWVCPNCDRQLDTYGSKGRKKENFCIDCGIKIQKSSTRCSKCYQKSRKISNTPDEL